jgi:hypothetical protein
MEKCEIHRIPATLSRFKTLTALGANLAFFNQKQGNPHADYQ